jgi:hypothetical protein
MHNLVKYNRVALPPAIIFCATSVFAKNWCVQNSYSGKVALECVPYDFAQSLSMYFLISLLAADFLLWGLGFVYKKFRLLHVFLSHLILFALTVSYYFFWSTTIITS